MAGPSASQQSAQHRQLHPHAAHGMQPLFHCSVAQVSLAAHGCPCSRLPGCINAVLPASGAHTRGISTHAMLTGGEVEEEGALVVFGHVQEIQRLGGQHICSKSVRQAAWIEVLAGASACQLSTLPMHTMATPLACC